MTWDTVGSRAAPDLRPGAFLTSAAASHSSAACAQRAPLCEVRTYLRCDSHAPNELPSAGQRGVAEQSRLDLVRASTSERLESVVSLRLQNREVLQQRSPYPVRRRIPEKGSLYYAGLNKPLKLKDWLGGLDSSRRNLKTTVKLSKLLFPNHLSRFALQPSTTFRNPQRRDSTLNV
jgi:hypothetical protein